MNGISGINAVGRFGIPSGTTIAGFALIDALLIRGIPVCVLDLGATLDGRPPQQLPMGVTHVQRYHDLPHSHTMILDSVFMIPKIMEFAGHAFAGQHISTVVYWELAHLPLAWKTAFAQCDTLFAPTSFVKEALKDSYHLNAPLCPVVPFHPYRPPAIMRQPGPFMFFTHFDALSTPARKNPYAALEAYCQAFGTRSDVRLLVKIWESTQWPFDRSLIQTYLERAPSITCLYDHLSYPETMKLMTQCDAYISLHRSEGLGLGILEAMSVGKPVIATDYGGSCDFLDVASGIPIAYHLVEVDSPQECYQPTSLGTQALWADPHIGEAAAAMLHLTENPAQAQRIGNQGYQRFLERKNDFLSLRWMRALAPALK